MARPGDRLGGGRRHGRGRPAGHRPAAADRPLGVLRPGLPDGAVDPAAGPGRAIPGAWPAGPAAAAARGRDRPAAAGAVQLAGARHRPGAGGAGGAWSGAAGLEPAAHGRPDPVRGPAGPGRVLPPLARHPAGGAGQAGAAGGVAGADPAALPVQHPQHRRGPGARAPGRGRAPAAGPVRPVPRRPGRATDDPAGGRTGAGPPLPGDRAAALRPAPAGEVGGAGGAAGGAGADPVGAAAGGERDPPRHRALAPRRRGADRGGLHRFGRAGHGQQQPAVRGRAGHPRPPGGAELGARAGPATAAGWRPTPAAATWRCCTCPRPDPGQTTRLRPPRGSRAGTRRRSSSGAARRRRAAARPGPASCPARRGSRTGRAARSGACPLP
ncbi:translation initiation factor IF-2 [Pseudoxanthomonas taiwanensis J19]|uniref:Translation initiation factor IF-2 n=1 Tax=Pseudoxanthomonas taiwanensis J19 TaxID=935569 RepID=A0A562DL56_9GAMM|nr:translation initiation factor IF-2 [Pseudoxanthomonas taiwanensis J19]